MYMYIYIVFLASPMQIMSASPVPIIFASYGQIASQHTAHDTHTDQWNIWANCLTAHNNTDTQHTTQCVCYCAL